MTKRQLRRAAALLEEDVDHVDVIINSLKMLSRKEWPAWADDDALPGLYAEREELRALAGALRKEADK